MFDKQNENKDFDFIIQNFDSLLGKRIQVIGRVIAIRKLKLSTFFDLDQRGKKLQIRTQTGDEDIPTGSIIHATGVCVYSSSGHRTIDRAQVDTVTKWEHALSYNDIQKTQQGPLHAFVRNIYSDIFFAQSARNYMRNFLISREFFEIQTPVLTKHYNGGRSVPVGISYFNTQIGYCRTTFEDRMQGYVAAGFERIFQIGSIFRSGKERTLLEGYSVFLGFDGGIQFMKDIMGHTVSELHKLNSGTADSDDATVDHIISQNWVEVDFLDEAAVILGIGKKHVAAGDSVMLTAVREKGLVDKDTTFETIGEKVGFAIAQKSKLPIIVKHFPTWSSPLYKQAKKDSMDILLRGRVYFKTQVGLHRLEFGVQENDYQNFAQRNEIQKRSWGLPENDERTKHSDLADIIAGGVPALFGFAIDPDWLLTIFGTQYSMDIYNEL
jgi:lysyl-tRNA synthetase class II